MAEDDSQGHMIHALNTAHIGDKWVRLDARGNRENMNAQFSLDGEQIAFQARSDFGEIDYHDNHADLDEMLVEVLSKCESPWEIPTDLKFNLENRRSI